MAVVGLSSASVPTVYVTYTLPGTCTGGNVVLTTVTASTCSFPSPGLTTSSASAGQTTVSVPTSVTLTTPSISAPTTIVNPTTVSMPPVTTAPTTIVNPTTVSIPPTTSSASHETLTPYTVVPPSTTVDVQPMMSDTCNSTDNLNDPDYANALAYAYGNATNELLVLNYTIGNYTAPLTEDQANELVSITFNLEGLLVNINDLAFSMCNITNNTAVYAVLFPAVKLAGDTPSVLENLAAQRDFIINAQGVYDFEGDVRESLQQQAALSASLGQRTSELLPAYLYSTGLQVNANVAQAFQYAIGNFSGDYTAPQN